MPFIYIYPLKSLLWMLNNDITDVIDETFSVSSTNRTVPLCKDGETREVNQDNKYEYVELVARWKTTFSVAVSLNPFLQVHLNFMHIYALDS
jgi:E3 ubiquitin-protein ligase HUWE1